MFGRHHDDDGKQAHENDDTSDDNRRLHYVRDYVSFAQRLRGTQG